MLLLLLLLLMFEVISQAAVRSQVNQRVPCMCNLLPLLLLLLLLLLPVFLPIPLRQHCHHIRAARAVRPCPVLDGSEGDVAAVT